MMHISECFSGLFHILFHILIYKNSFSYFLMIQYAFIFQKKLYWWQIEYNLLFHKHICVSLLVFINFGGGYTLRLIKSKLGLILQDLFFHTKLEWFRKLFDTIHWQYLWQIFFLQKKKCETQKMKMRLNDAHFRVVFQVFFTL